MKDSTTLSENIWISASAGSGKTKALIDRFLKILLNGTPPTKILCITFTKAAAAEMFQRITYELTEWATCDEMTLIDKVKKLIGTDPRQSTLNLARTCFDKFIEARGEIHINTIHAFCQNLIERFPLECGIELGCKLADDQLVKTLVQEAKVSFLNDDSIFQDESVRYLFADLNESKLDMLLDKILAAHNLYPNFFMTRERLIAYIESIRKDLKLPDNYSQERELKALTTEIRKKINEAKEANIITINFFDQTITTSDMDVLANFKNIFLTKKNTPRLRVLSKEETTPESKILINEIQNLLLAYIENESAYKIYKQTFGVMSLGHFFMEHYINMKNQQGLLDYGDLIQRGLALFKGGEASSWFLYHLNNRFHNILVDEAQDLNTMQWDFVKTLSSEFFYNADIEDRKSIFVVGDPKQSIYSFQGASPLLFGQTKEQLEELAKHYKIKIAHSELNESFRSDPIILKFVDKVFQLLRKRNPEYFVEHSEHIANKKFEKSSIEVWPLISKQEDEGSAKKTQTAWQITKEYKEIQSPSTLLTKKITVRIKNLLQEDYLPSDILILVRKRDKLMNQIVTALKSESIPVSGADRLILNESLAIQDLLSLGRFLLSQYDDYNLACLLKSPIFAVTEEELFELCDRGNISLWENIKQQTKPEYKKISEILNSLLEDEKLFSPYQLFSHVLDILKFRTAFLSRFGMHLDEILDEFLNVCLDFESKQSTSLSLFIDWFVKTDIEIKRDSYATSNEVRLMTVHASKGLQAKVVILPDTTSTPKYKKDGVLFNAAIRKLISYQGAGDHPFCKTLLDKTELQTLQEYYRLLYVALTRAAEKLIICGWSNKKKLHPDCWYTLLDEVASSNNAHC